MKDTKPLKIGHGLKPMYTPFELVYNIVEYTSFECMYLLMAVPSLRRHTGIQEQETEEAWRSCQYPLTDLVFAPRTTDDRDSPIRHGIT